MHSRLKTGRRATWRMLECHRGTIQSIGNDGYDGYEDCDSSMKLRWSNSQSKSVHCKNLFRRI